MTISVVGVEQGFLNEAVIRECFAKFRSIRRVFLQVAGPSVTPGRYLVDRFDGRLFELRVTQPPIVEV